MPASKTGQYTSFAMVIQAIPMVIVPLYFKFIKDDWRKIYWACTGLIFLAILPVFLWLPESPKYLYDKKRYGECRAALL